MNTINAFAVLSDDDQHIISDEVLPQKVEQSQSVSDSGNKKSWASIVSATPSEVKTFEEPSYEDDCVQVPLEQLEQSTDSSAGEWKVVGKSSRKKAGDSKKKQTVEDRKDRRKSHSDVPKRVMDIPTSRPKKTDDSEHVSKRPGDSFRRQKPIGTDSKIIPKKVLESRPPARQGNISLPSYYGIRLNTSVFEIAMCEYDWIKRVGGLEKSTTIEHMFKGAMACAISYYENYMTKNKFFQDKISLDIKDQEKTIELICIQTTAILFHRLIKSDSVEIVKTILKNVPLYRTVSGNPSDKATTRESHGSSLYMSVRRKFIDDLRITHKKTTTSYTEEEIADAQKRIMETENRWKEYILQSVWNGNNPIHDCLYYGAKSSLEFLLCHLFENGMHEELNNMMLVRNIQNESHVDIVGNGRKACEAQGSLNIIRKKQYIECEQLYNKTIETLCKHMDSTIDDEVKNILGLTVEPDLIDGDVSSVDVDKDITMETSQLDSVVPSVSDSVVEDESDAEGDNVNIYSLISNGNVEGMAKHIDRCAKNGKFDIMHKTFDVWRQTASTDTNGELGDYISDVEFLCENSIRLMNEYFAQTSQQTSL